MRKIVVLGGGIGGLSAAFELKDELGDRPELAAAKTRYPFCRQGGKPGSAGPAQSVA